MRIEVIIMARGPRIKGPKKTFGLLMPLEMYEQLEKHAELRQRPVSSYIRQILKWYLWYEENVPELLVKHWSVL